MLGLVIISIILANIYAFTFALCKASAKADDQSNSKEGQNSAE